MQEHPLAIPQAEVVSLAFVESLARTWFRRVWTELDATAIDELFAEDGEAYGIHGETIEGPRGFREFHTSFCAVFSDIAIEVVKEVANSDESAAQCRATMVHRMTGAPVVMTGTVFFAFRGEQIHRAWNHWDFLGLLESMQLMPARSFELAVSGRLAAHPGEASTAHPGEASTGHPGETSAGFAEA